MVFADGTSQDGIVFHSGVCFNGEEFVFPLGEMQARILLSLFYDEITQLDSLARRRKRDSDSSLYRQGEGVDFGAWLLHNAYSETDVEFILRTRRWFAHSTITYHPDGAVEFRDKLNSKSRYFTLEQFGRLVARVKSLNFQHILNKRLTATVSAYHLCPHCGNRLEPTGEELCGCVPRTPIVVPDEPDGAV